MTEPKPQRAREPQPPHPQHPVDRADQALSTCTYCPSLCRHACPVARVEASDTVTPWGMMSLANHFKLGRVEGSAEVYETLSACVGCSSCTAVCLHEVDVASALVEVKRSLAAAGHAPPATSFIAPDLVGAHPADHPFFESLRVRARYEERPLISLVPGFDVIAHAPGLVHALFSVCERLDVDALACGELARLDPGYDAWQAGHFPAFVEQARRFHAATAGARDIVVFSPETLHLLRDVYPRFGLSISAELLHVAEFLLPLLSGAFVHRLPERVTWFSSCHSARHLDLRDIPRQVVRRALEHPIAELPTLNGALGCCGGTGCGPTQAGRRLSDALADEVMATLADLGVPHLATFSSECFVSLAHAAERRHARALSTPTIEHGLSILARAVVRDGGAA